MDEAPSLIADVKLSCAVHVGEFFWSCLCD
jgi:hypothetical protein